MVALSDGQLAQVVELYFQHVGEVFHLTGAIPVQMWALWANPGRRTPLVCELQRDVLQGLRDAQPDGTNMQAFARALLRGECAPPGATNECQTPPDAVVQVVNALVLPLDDGWARVRLVPSHDLRTQPNAILTVATSRENSFARVDHLGDDERLTQSHDGCFEYRPRGGEGALFRLQL